MTLVDPPETIERVAFLGTPEIAVPALQAVLETGYEVPLVVTGPDRRRGRGSAISFTPVKRLAVERGLTVTSDLIDLHDHDVDLAVVVAFGRLIGRDLLERIPMVNLHFSLLPRWRGAAPVERAILAGDAVTGVALMQVAEGLDVGDIWAEETVAVHPGEYASDLKDRLAVIGADLLVRTLQRGFGPRRPQTGEPIYAAKITSADRRLRWSDPAEQLERVVRVGGAWTTFRGRRLKIHEVAVIDGVDEVGRYEDGRVGTGAGLLELRSVQAEGKPRMTADEWARGARPDGEVFDR